MHDHADPWGVIIRGRRRELGLRQDQLAALAGVSTRSIHAIESSKPTVRLDVLTAVLDVLGLALVVEGPTSRVVVSS